MIGIRLSVIVPCYNAEKYIGHCLKAISDVECSDMEVLLVDDGSTDRTGEICDQLAAKDSRFQVFHKANGGVGSARNYALSRSLGEWITFVDADDIPTSSLLLFNPSDETDLVCFNWKYTTGETITNEYLDNHIFKGGGLKSFLEKKLVCRILKNPWSKMFRRKIIVNNQICFDSTLQLGEDTLFVLDYLLFCNTLKTNSAVGYTYLESSPTKYNMPFQSRINILSLFLERYKHLNINCPCFLHTEDYFLSEHIGKLSFIERTCWEHHVCVQEIRHICWNLYSWKRKTKFNVLRILGVILYGNSQL